MTTQNNGLLLDMVFEPEILCPRHSTDEARIRALMNKPDVKIHDEYRSMYGEYLKCSYPSRKLKGATLLEAITEHLAGKDLFFEGNWVYYPWSGYLVHILEEKAFIKTRNSPNNPKITLEEQAFLSNKKVGVVGLSVGQSVSVALAMERLCGELRIADFDILELPNLNRIRAGISSLGLHKTIVVAREIKEIDPYFKVVPYHEGLQTSNIDLFFTGGGPLDLVVDECDSIEIKIALRHQAKRMGIPVVMDMSDRGTVDLERFDLEPGRPIMHGWLEHLDTSNVAGLSNEEKVPYMMPIFGMDTISKRLKASMVEIGQSIHTWPQLATSVAMGGAMAADCIRRIFLNKLTVSGRFFVDLDDLIRDPLQDEPSEPDNIFICSELTEATCLEIAQAWSIKHQIAGGGLIKEDLEAVMQLAVTAPSAGNMQPWKWLFWKGMLFLYHDKNKSWSWTDFDHTMAWMGLGAAIECTKMALLRQGYESDIYQINEDQDALCAVFVAKKEQMKATEPLLSGLKLRCTNRKKGVPYPFTPEDADKLASSITCEHARVDFITDKKQLALMGDVVGRAEKIRFLHPEGHHDFFMKEVRWNDAEAKLTADGLDVKTMELSAQDLTGLEVLKDYAVIELIKEWKVGNALKKNVSEGVASSSALGLVTLEGLSREKILTGGRQLFRLWIKANMEGWSIQPVSAPLFFYNRSQKESHLLTNEMLLEIDSYASVMKEVYPILHSRSGFFLFRISKADAPSELALRKNWQLLTFA